MSFLSSIGSGIGAAARGIGDAARGVAHQGADLIRGTQDLAFRPIQKVADAFGGEQGIAPGGCMPPQPQPESELGGIMGALRQIVQLLKGMQADEQPAHSSTRPAQDDSGGGLIAMLKELMQILTGRGQDDPVEAPGRGRLAEGHHRHAHHC